MLSKILGSNLFAYSVLGVAAYSLVLVYLRGWKTAALLGAILLAVAAVMVIRGIRQQKTDKPGHPTDSHGN